jgi:hypothetical protein
MTIQRVLAVAALAALTLSTPLPAGDSSGAASAWDRMKTLVGDWTGTYAGSDGTGKVSLSYKLVSNGSGLLETMNGAHDADMVTMYHLDGNRIMATHYCAAGNQPRMAASGLSADGKTIAFAFLDATNVTDPNEELMRGLVVTFQDADHFQQSWTSRGGGKDQVGVFNYTRK